MTLAEVQLGEIEKEVYVKDCILEINRVSKTLILDNGSEISLPVSSSVGKDDCLIFDGKSLYVKCNDGLVTLLPPYREHLSQAFARFFMRVGLPLDIAPFHKKFELPPS